MTVSVIIPTYNGVHRILNTLKALETQNFKDFETVVVVDGSTDHTLKTLQNYPSSLKELRVIAQPNGGRARVRNMGAKEAGGDLLIFYDDDMRPTNDSVEKHKIFHESRQNCICGGNQLEEDKKCKTDIQKYKRHLGLSWTSKYHNGLNELKKENLFLTAANFSIPKSLFERLGGFDERLKDAEDFELGIRALEHGYNVYFDKSNIAWHDDYITCNSYIIRQRQYMKANESLSHKLPKAILRKTLHIHEMNLIKRLVFSIFANPVLVKMIDKEFFTFLPRAARYKIYDLTITSLGKVFPNKALS